MRLAHPYCLKFQCFQDALKVYVSLERRYCRYLCAVFNRDFNVGFEPPKSNTCACVKKKVMNEIKNSSDSNRVNKLTVKKELHLKHAKPARTLHKSLKDDNNTSVVVLCFYLQQAVPTPKLTSVQFYKRKLRIFNFCVHNMKSNTTSMYL